MKLFSITLDKDYHKTKLKELMLLYQKKAKQTNKKTKKKTKQNKTKKLKKKKNDCKVETNATTMVTKLLPNSNRSAEKL